MRWLDFNDTWLAAEWGHPSDNLGTILAVADYLSRRELRDGGKPLTVHDVPLSLGYDSETTMPGVLGETTSPPPVTE